MPPSQTHVQLSSSGSTRATAYGMSNKVISRGDWTYVAWLDFVAEIKARATNRKTGEWTETIHVGTGVDNHSGPAITMDFEGYLHILYGPHHGPFEYKRSTHPHDISEWSDPEPVGELATYPSLICGADDTLYLAYRSSNPDSRKNRHWRIHFHKKERGKPWGVSKPLFDIGVPDYGWFGNSLAIDAEQNLHLAFNTYNLHPKGSPTYGYLRSNDRGATWTNATGDLMDTPVTREADCFILRDPRANMWIKSNVVGPDQNPWFICIHIHKYPRTVELNHWTGAEWERTDLRPILNESFPDKEIVDASLTFDSAGKLFCVVTAGEPSVGTDYWGHPSSELYLLTSTDRGKSFAVEPLTDTDLTRPAWIASIERPHSSQPIPGNPALIYTRGGPGKGCEGGPATEVFYMELTS